MESSKNGQSCCVSFDFTYESLGTRSLFTASLHIPTFQSSRDSQVSPNTLNKFQRRLVSMYVCVCACQFCLFSALVMLWSVYSKLSVTIRNALTFSMLLMFTFFHFFSFYFHSVSLKAFTYHYYYSIFVLPLQIFIWYVFWPPKPLSLSLSLYHIYIYHVLFFCIVQKHIVSRQLTVGG